MVEAPVELPARFRLRVRVYYEDTDSGGVVYYANYLKYLERARTEWLRSLGYNQQALVHDGGVLFAVRSVQADYLAPARLDDELGVDLCIESSGRASIDFLQTIVRERDGHELMRARVRVVCVHATTFRPAAIPPDIKEAFSGEY